MPEAVLDTSTACTHCGNLGTPWIIKIIRNPFGGGYTVVNQIFLNKRYKTTLKDLECRICHADNQENTYEHIRLTEAALKKIPTTVSFNHVMESLTKLGDRFNTQVQSYAKERKPDTGSDYVISTRESHRTKATGIVGLECKECNTLFTFDNKILEPQSCPQCGELQPIKDKDLIRL